MALPLSKAQVVKGTGWLISNFGSAINTAIAGKPYSRAILCAIACKETGFIWISRIDTMEPSELLPRLVGDASGDVAGAPRSAFPKNTAKFRARFGDAFTEKLISQSNKARAIRGLGPAQIVYKGTASISTTCSMCWRTRSSSRICFGTPWTTASRG